MNYSNHCGYYSEAKRDTCQMERGHEKRHFKYEDEGGPFSKKEEIKRAQAKRQREFDRCAKQNYIR